MNTVHDVPVPRRLPSAADTPPRHALTTSSMAELTKNPTLALPADPPELRLWVVRFWQCVEGKLPTARPIAFTLATWIGEYGLLPEEALAVLKTLTHPARLAKLKFAGDVEQALAAEAADAIRRREAEQALVARKAAEAASEAAHAKNPRMAGFPSKAPDPPLTGGQMAPLVAEIKARLRRV